jgi:hypothetical protein
MSTLLTDLGAKPTESTALAEVIPTWIAGWEIVWFNSGVLFVGMVLFNRAALFSGTGLLTSEELSLI